MKNKQIILLIITLLVVAIMAIMVIEPENKETTKTNGNTISGNNLKLEEMIDDAKYTYNVSGSYMNEKTEKEYSLKNIVLPQFLFKTEDANQANQEIEGLYQTLAKEFEEAFKGEQNKFVETWYDVIRAKVFLSVKITVQRIDAEGEKYEYYTYVFDLDDLELIEYVKLANKLDVPESELETKVTEGIKKLDEFEDLKEKDCPDGKTPEDYVEATLKNYQEAEKDGTLLYYVDAVGRINVIIPIEVPNATGDMQRDIKIK